jgi:hypothetical protein
LIALPIQKTPNKRRTIIRPGTLVPAPKRQPTNDPTPNPRLLAQGDS